MTTNLEEFCVADQKDMNDVCQRAYDGLSLEEQIALDKIIVELEAAVRKRRQIGQGLGRQSRLELLAKLGLWLKDQGR